MEANANNPTQPGEPASWTQSVTRTGLIAGVFSAIVSVLLLLNHFQGQAADPLSSKALAELKAALVRDPMNEPLKAKIRALDLDLRQKHALHVARGEVGGWMLIGGITVFLVSIKPATHRRKLPRPVKRSASERAREIAQIRWGIVVFAALVGCVAWTLSSTAKTFLVVKSNVAAPANPPPAAVAAVAVAPFPSAEELQKNWPRFRGPGGSAVSIHTNIPLTWNGKTGEGILWKATVPAGPGSPVIWNERVFLTAATAAKREVFCLDAASGKVLWQKPVDPPRTNAEPPTVMEDSGGYGPSTPYTDGRRVYAIFANGDVAAFDMEGNPVWARNLGTPDNSYGHATSLEMFQDKLLVQLDQASAKEGKSKLLALDAATGKPAWQSEPRPVPASWATPLVIKAGQKDQIVTCGNPWVISYDPGNGKEIWRAKALYGEVLPSPIFAAGLIFTAMDGDKLSAIKPDGSGDVTATHIVWTAQDGLPDVVSPVSDGVRVYLISSSGTLTCYEAKTGKKLWEKETEISFQSSPAVAGNRLYLVSDKGVTLVAQAGGEFKELARSELGEKVLASPAFADGRIFIRGQQTLFCIGKPPR